MDLENLNEGIWDLLERNKTNILDLTKYRFKQYYTVMQHIQNLSNISYFCIEYNKYDGYSKTNCIKPKIKREYFNPSININ